jgi:hypothetical protein
MKKKLFFIFCSVIFIISCGIDKPLDIEIPEYASESINFASLDDYKTYYNNNDTYFVNSILKWPDEIGYDTANSYIYTADTGLFYERTGLIWLPDEEKIAIGSGKPYATQKPFSLIANLSTDAIFFYSRLLVPETNFYFSNGGGIRDDKSIIADNGYVINFDEELSPTMQSSVFFYANYLEVLRIKGENMLAMFELAAEPGNWGKHGQFSGVKVEYNILNELEYEVSKITLTTRTDTKVWEFYSDTENWIDVYHSQQGGWVNGYNSDSFFFIGVSNYLAAGGDDYTMLYYAKNFQDGFVDFSPTLFPVAFSEYIKYYKVLKNDTAVIMPVINNRKVYY